ncbi:MAG: hypothetical protein NZ530_03230 [Thermodesulfobacteriaceae bacterium]|nr:hypothetical protein [Thermodesulfobacteriaceae bacterium]MCX8041653.1 hypothetical protein [Thermodesulfobacteriaceae bacterium]MDW8135305.1 hypothetical protein [Thermodesulfobacterium sp.]
MSGLKYSEYQLEREKEEKIQLLQEIANFKNEIELIKDYLEDLLHHTSEGLKLTFFQEVKEAQKWLDTLEIPKIEDLSMDTELSILRKTHSQLKEIVEKGRKIQEVLTFAFTQKADEMGKTLTKKLNDLKQFYFENYRVLKLWWDEKSINYWKTKIEEGYQLLEEEKYGILSLLLDKLYEELKAKVEFSKLQEEKHQKRLYLLKALRQVCKDMGFEEIVSPHYEKEGDRGSRILFTVDTFDRGKIEFAISLDSINTFSEASEDKCFEEFDQLSQFLEEEYGIRTEFKYEDGLRPPKLIKKGEMELPGDAVIKIEK